MKKALFSLPLLIATASPAQATGGMTCRTAGPGPIEVSIVIGHAAGPPLASGRMVDDGRSVEVKAIQWWLDPTELRLLLVDPDATRTELTLKAKKNGQFYDGTVERSGRSRWVRCRES